MTRTQGISGFRSMAASVVCVVLAITLTGCGATHSMLGIRQAPKANPASTPLTVEQAERILTRVFAVAYRSETTTGAAAAAAQKSAYTGEGLRAVHARVKLAKTLPTPKDSPFVAPTQPRILAMARGFGFPRFILAQSVPLNGGVPVIHLLTSPDAATSYRISGSAEMVPLARVKPFDPPGRGSPLVTNDAGLAVAPAALLKSYAEWMAYPARSATKLPFAADPFSGQVRAQAAGVAKAVESQATFSQVHKVVRGSSYAVRQASGDVLVLGVIERKDSFAVKSGQAVNTVANKAFVVLTGKKAVTRSASLTTQEFVVFAVPRSSGRATLVAAREQVVAGSGS